MTETTDIVYSRHKGQAITIDHAPARARLSLQSLTDRYAYLTMPDRDVIVFADQVVYRITGYDTADAVLELELVEDWRPSAAPPAPEPSDPAAAYAAMRARWQENHRNGEPPAVVAVVKAEEQHPA